MLIYAADDEQAVLYYTEEALKTCFPTDEIIAFEDPASLLDAFKKRPCDIVFLDIEMPGMTGIELAKALIEIKENLNIVFLTGYSTYAKDAFDVYASDYVMKPCSAEKVRKAVSKLRYPIKTEKEIYIKTFGNFDMFVRGEPIRFSSSKVKELLAYLVDREGAAVSRREADGILFDGSFSRSSQVTLTRIAAKLAKDLQSAGIENFLLGETGYRWVDLSIADCDFIEYRKGNPKYPFIGEYMEQYSWGEDRKGIFLRISE